MQNVAENNLFERELRSGKHKRHLGNVSAAELGQIVLHLLPINKHKIFVSTEGTLSHKLVANFSPRPDKNIVLILNKEVSDFVEEVEVVSRYSSSCCNYGKDACDCVAVAVNLN